MKILKRQWTDNQIIDIKALRENHGLEFTEIADYINKKYDVQRTGDSISGAYKRYKNLYEVDSKKTYFNHLKEIARTKRNNSKIGKENRIILNNAIDYEDILESIKVIVSPFGNNKEKIFKPKKGKNKKKSKRGMTIEIMLSDLHYGKLTKEFDAKIARERMRELCSVTINEIKSESKEYNVERIIIAMLGDMIESYTMHGLESSSSCEMGNSEQIQLAIESLFWDFITPICALGIKVDIPAVTGNHDRTEKNRTYNNPGKSNVTYIIYKTLEMLCESKGFTNATFYIPDGPYQDLEIYGDTVLYEHGDNSGNGSRQSLEKTIYNRSSQIGKIITFYRLGHFHFETMFGRGRAIINGNLPGQDSYGDTKGYVSHSSQTLNFYIKTNKRPNSFFKTFPVYLGGGA